MALFFITRMPPLGVAFVWAFLKVLVNVFMVFKIMNERQPIKLSVEELDVYEEHFMRFGVTARQFKRFWDMGETRELAGETLLTEEGKKVEAVTLVLDGHVYRTMNGVHIPSLDTYPGIRHHSSFDGDAGAWVGELTVLRAIDSISQHHTVVTPAQDAETQKVQQLQMVLADLGLYDGEVDGWAGAQTSRALEKLEEQTHLKLDGVDGPKTLQAAEQLNTRLNFNTSSWTAHAAKGSIVRSWKFEPLMEVCEQDAELCGMLRKAFSQSTITKLMAMQPQKEKAPIHEFEAVSLSSAVLGAYESALSKALSRGRVLPEEKVTLIQFRRQHGISDSQHAAALEKVGWTVDEYDLGSLFSHLGDINGCSVADFLRDFPVHDHVEEDAHTELHAFHH